MKTFAEIKELISKQDLDIEIYYYMNGNDHFYNLKLPEKYIPKIAKFCLEKQNNKIKFDLFTDTYLNKRETAINLRDKLSSWIEEIGDFPCHIENNRLYGENDNEKYSDEVLHTLIIQKLNDYKNEYRNEMINLLELIKDDNVSNMLKSIERIKKINNLL